MKLTFICAIVLASVFAMAAQKPQAVFSIPTISPKKQNIAQIKQYYATISADESRNISLSVRVDGFIQKLFVDKIYTQVAKGEPLFSLYSAELIDAQSEFLATRNRLSNEKLALLGVDSKEIDKIAKTHKILNEVTFYAPIDGVVFTKNVNVGSGVKKGDEVFRFIKLDNVWAIASINQEDLAFLKASSTKAYIMVEGNSEKIPAELEMVYPQVSEGFLKARFVIDNAKGDIFPDMFAYVFIESPATQRLTLPSNAVLYKDRKYFVFVEDDGAFLPQEVEAKRIMGTKFYEILSGVHESQKVAQNALFILDSDAQNNGDYE